MRRPRKTVTDWEAVVFQHRAPGIANGVRVLLLYLARHMRSNLQVSVPRSRIARDLGISEREVTNRIKAARDACLLDTIVSARPRVTAVYAATFPADFGTIRGGTPWSPQRCDSPSLSRGDHVVPSETPFRGDHVVPPISKHSPDFHRQVTSPRGDEEMEHPPTEADEQTRSRPTSPRIESQAADGPDPRPPATGAPSTLNTKNWKDSA